MGKFAGGLDRGVFVGKFGEWDGFWEERDGVYYAFGMCAWYPDTIALAMVEGFKDDDGELLELYAVKKHFKVEMERDPDYFFDEVAKDDNKQPKEEVLPQVLMMK